MPITNANFSRTALFTNNRQDRLPVISMNNETSQSTKCMKLLGVTLDSGLNMDKHSKNLKSEGSGE